MSSIFQGQIDKNTNKKWAEEYNKAEDTVRRKNEDVSGINVSKIKEDYILLKNGAVIKIQPAFIASQVQYAIETMRSDAAYTFIKPFINKPVIWTYEVKTACTDGIRIYMSPLFAHQMLRATKPEVDAFVKSWTGTDQFDQEKHDEKNRLITKLVRFVIVHEVYHILYNHCRRGILKYGSHPEEQEHTRGNIAMDLEINRDIESCFPELRGSTKVIEGIWWEDPNYYKSDGSMFKRDIWEDIWDDWTNHNKELKNDDNFNDEDANPTQKNKAQQGAFADGWRKAVDAIKNKQIDPRTFKI